MAIAATARERRVPLFEEPDPLDELVRATIWLPRRVWQKIDAIAEKEAARLKKHVSRAAVLERMTEVQISAYEKENGAISVGHEAAPKLRAQKKK